MKNILIASIITLSVIIYSLATMYFVSIEKFDGQNMIYTTITGLILAAVSMVSITIIDLKNNK